MKLYNFNQFARVDEAKFMGVRPGDEVTIQIENILLDEDFINSQIESAIVELGIEDLFKRFKYNQDGLLYYLKRFFNGSKAVVKEMANHQSVVVEFIEPLDIAGKSATLGYNVLEPIGPKKEMGMSHWREARSQFNAALEEMLNRFEGDDAKLQNMFALLIGTLEGFKREEADALSSRDSEAESILSRLGYKK